VAPGAASEVTVKALIDIAPRRPVFKTACKQAKAAESLAGFGADCHLRFESARALLAELTPARIDLLEALRPHGPCSMYALASEVERNYSNVHTDIGKLEEHGLVQRTPEDLVFLPFEPVEIHSAPPKRAA
jgi:predicted transcriptional regulator